MTDTLGLMRRSKVCAVYSNRVTVKHSAVKFLKFIYEEQYTSHSMKVSSMKEADYLKLALYARQSLRVLKNSNGKPIVNKFGTIILISKNYSLKTYPTSVGCQRFQ